MGPCCCGLWFHDCRVDNGRNKGEMGGEASEDGYDVDDYDGSCSLSAWDIMTAAAPNVCRRHKGRKDVDVQCRPDMKQRP